MGTSDQPDDDIARLEDEGGPDPQTLTQQREAAAEARRKAAEAESHEYDRQLAIDAD